MFTYLSQEERVPVGSSLAADSNHGGRGGERTISVVWATIRRLKPALDRAGKAVARAGTGCIVFDWQWADAPAVPRLRGSEHGRTGVGSRRVQQELRPVAEWRYRRKVLRTGIETGTLQRPVVG